MEMSAASADIDETQIDGRFPETYIPVLNDAIYSSSAIQNHQTPMDHSEKRENFVIDVLADDIAPSSARTSEYAAMTTFNSHKHTHTYIYICQVMKVQLSCYLVLLSNDSKTR